MTPPKPVNYYRLFIAMLVVSLGANAFLVWQWQTERITLQSLIAGQQVRLESSSITNRRLARQNTTIKTALTEKDQELAQKIAEVAAKQKEVEAATKQLDEKKKELDTKKSELTTAQKQITDQKSQLEANSSELSKLRNRPPLFSFQNESSSLTDVEAKKADVKAVVTAAYDTIEEIYGKPYLLHSVTITFVDSFSNEKAAGEIVISNSDEGLELTIKIKDFDKNSFNDVNTVIHEIIHSFHGLAVFEPTAFEEGITVAAADAVMKKMIAAGSIPSFSPLYLRLSSYPEIAIPRSQSAFYGSSEVATMYQVLGKAWYDRYAADGGFFKKVNEAVYAKKNAGEEITEQVVLDAVRAAAPGVGLTGSAWELR